MAFQGIEHYKELGGVGIGYRVHSGIRFTPSVYSPEMEGTGTRGNRMFIDHMLRSLAKAR